MLRLCGELQCHDPAAGAVPALLLHPTTAVLHPGGALLLHAGLRDEPGAHAIHATLYHDARGSRSGGESVAILDGFPFNYDEFVMFSRFNGSFGSVTGLK